MALLPPLQITNNRQESRNKISRPKDSLHSPRTPHNKQGVVVGRRMGRVVGTWAAGRHISLDPLLDDVASKAQGVRDDRRVAGPH